MRVTCFCKRYLVNPENAAYVKNGIPLCNERTCERVKAHREEMVARFNEPELPFEGWPGVHEHL